MNLKVVSKSKIENSILQKIDFKKKHNDTISINLEIDKISNYLKNIGYFTATIDSTTIVSKEHIVYFSLNDKIENVLIHLNSDLKFSNYKIEQNTISIPIEKLHDFLSEVSSTLEQQGRSFSKVQLKNINIREKTLIADLEILKSEKRILNNAIVKGYENFPSSFLKNYFNIKSNSVFNQKKIQEISILTKGLSFIKEIKPPEILFTKDSTLLYLYLKKHQNNSFDGIVNFASKEDGKLLFNGNIDLKLQNMLDSGEKIELLWSSIADDRQEFKISTKIPYIFNSAISPEIAFSIYKQDSTFLNTVFNSKFKYAFSEKLEIGLSYDSEKSSELNQSTITSNITSFTNSFIGFQLSYIKPKFDLFFNNKLDLEINPSFGKRKSENESSNQFKLKTITSYIWDINFRNSIYIKNETGYLNSDTYLNNELFRIGGANSIRGYTEQSIFTSSYTFFNIEYRFLTSEKSYIYSITDVGNIKENKKKLLSIGLGYKFINNNTLINIAAAINKDQNNQFQLKNSKIIINWIVYF